MTWHEAINLIAIIIGPVLAVCVTLGYQSYTEARERRLSVFRSLMKTRRRTLDPEHVSALNMVEVEFFKDKDVRAALGAYVALFNQRMPSEGEAGASEFWEKFNRDREEKLVLLLDKMARKLGYGFEQLEILKGGYAPRYYDDVELESQKARRLFAHLYDLSNGRGLPIDVVDYRTAEQIRSAADALEQKLSIPGQR